MSLPFLFILLIIVNLKFSCKCADRNELQIIQLIYSSKELLWVEVRRRIIYFVQSKVYVFRESKITGITNAKCQNRNTVFICDIDACKIRYQWKKRFFSLNSKGVALSAKKCEVFIKCLLSYVMYNRCCIKFNRCIWDIRDFSLTYKI